LSITNNFNKRYTIFNKAITSVKGASNLLYAGVSSAYTFNVYVT